MKSNIDVFDIASGLDNLMGNEEGNYVGLSHFLRLVRNILFRLKYLLRRIGVSHLERINAAHKSRLWNRWIA